MKECGEKKCVKMAVIYNIRSIYMVALIDTADIRVKQQEKTLKAEEHRM